MEMRGQCSENKLGSFQNSYLNACHILAVYHLFMISDTILWFRFEFSTIPDNIDYVFVVYFFRYLSENIGKILFKCQRISKSQVHAVGAFTYDFMVIMNYIFVGWRHQRSCCLRDTADLN